MTVAIFHLLGIVSLTLAELDCQAGSCEASSSDEFSLIQGFLQPDTVSEVLKKGVELHSVKSDPVSTTTAGTTTQSYALEGSEVKLNAAGDLAAFMSAIQLNVGMTVFFVVVFLFLQGWYPLMFARRWINQNVLEYNDDKISQEQGYFGWMGKAINTPILEMDRDRLLVNDPTANVPPSIEIASGLDAAMLMKFTNLALELMVGIGVPACLLGIPIYAFAGGGFAGEDSLSWAGIGNVIYDNSALTGLPMPSEFAGKVESTQWIFWTVACSVWVVIIFVQWRMSCYQRTFVKARLKWLERMTAPRSTTVLVQGIDLIAKDGEEPRKRSNEELKDFFEELFGKDCVEHAFVIKHTNNLNTLIAQYETLKTAEDAGELKLKLQEIKDEQKLVDTNPDFLTTNGFVTFKDRRDAERALGVRLDKNDDIWVLETPPAVTDVRYQDFEASDAVAGTSQLIGYAAVAALFLTFMPLVVGINHVSYALEEIPPVLSMLESTGMKSTVDGTLATMGLTVMMSMLPTFLAWIFQAFYQLKANRWEQIQIQTYYYWFLVLFVLLTTSVGSNLSATLSALAQSPFEIFSLLAEQMPITTHFYLNYVILQPVTHAMNLTRYISLTKFLIFRRSCTDPAEAADLAEPEDQDYYGIGSRSARFALMLLIGLVFGTICPLMNVMTFFNFITCRFIYGYLIPFQERRKDDMGGVHWCIQMHHMQQGLLIYLVMMTGILAERATSLGPCAVSAVSFLWWWIAYRKFSRSMQWEKLPYASMFDFEKGKEKLSFQKKREDDKTYEQPQLVFTGY
jgi:hypothetical protein